jgi:hypothetical protein
MKIINSCFLIQLVSTFIFMSQISQISAQESNNGQRGIFSSGQLSMTLEITVQQKTADEMVYLLEPGIAKVPGNIESTLTKSLAELGTIEIPVCLVSSKGGEMTVSLNSEESGEMILTAINGEEFSYDVNLSGNRWNGNGDSKKIQHEQAEDGICDKDSAILVKIALTETSNERNPRSLKGGFVLLVNPE